MKTHISLNVNNVSESIEFYSKMLGVEPAKVKSDYAKFDVGNPSLNLALNQLSFEKGGSLSHLGLQVETTEEVETMSKRWQENGLLILEENQTDCCYALQDKVWVTDPDGNSWEVFVVLKDTGNEKTSESNCCMPDENLIGIESSQNSAICC